MRLVDVNAERLSFKQKIYEILTNKNSPKEQFILIMDVFDSMSIAYDIDKVVEELEELDVKAITRYKNGNFGNFDGVEYYIKKRKAIEIVKQGGVGKEMESD